MTLRHIFRDLFRHSTIYGIGQILSRIASILLLPLYTRYLPPSSYGVIAILDLTSSILGSLIGGGLFSALSRYHFDHEDTVDRSVLWWSGITMVAAIATAIVGPAFLLREPLAILFLGPEVSGGSSYLALSLPVVWLQAVASVLDAHLQVRKQSMLFVALGLGRLLFNIAFNLIFLLVFDMGMAAILLGNLLAAGLYVIALFVVVLPSLRPFRIDGGLVAPLWSYGSPLIITSLLLLLLHNGDRLILRQFVSMQAVGIYSLAYTLGQGINAMFLLPFSAIWTVSIFEIAAAQAPERAFSVIFRYFFDAFVLLMLGVSLLAEPLIRVLAAPEYGEAARLVPVVCLAYVFFGLQEQFKVPVLLAKRTSMLPPIFLVATAVNVLANLLLIPTLGVSGAAWASVASFAVLASFGLWRYRSIARYPYPLARCAAVLLGVVSSFAAFDFWASSVEPPMVGRIIVAALVWSTWTALLFGRRAAIEISILFGSSRKDLVVEGTNRSE